MSTSPASTTASSTPSSEQTGGFSETRDRKTFPCESCGAPLVFSVGAQQLKCEHCGFEKALQFDEGQKPVSENDLSAGLQRQAERRAEHDGRPAQQEVACNACGAIVVFDGSLTSSTCSYCDTPLQIKNAHVADHAIPVDGLCTFAIEKEQAQKNLRAWVQGRWFAPGAWVKRGVEGKFDGVYMPFFTFDAMTFTHYRGERGDAYYVEVGSGDNKRRERRVNWTAAFGAFQRFFDDVCIPAMKSLPDTLLRGLEPWPAEKVIPFTDSALAGKRSHAYERTLDECFSAAKHRIDDELRSDVRRRIGGDEQRVHAIDTQYSALTYKHVLLPVWILAYRYGDKPYRVVVNAVTGQVNGERPWSVPKILAAVVAGVILLAIIASLSSKQ